MSDRRSPQAAEHPDSLPLGPAWMPHAQAFGRAALASLFVLGGINKLLTWNEVSARMASVGLEPVALLLPATVLLELGGGLLLAAGVRKWQAAAWAAVALSAFTLVTNAVFHRFWEMAPPVRALELSLFFKNVAIAGALWMFAAQRLCRSSVDPEP
jgi:putative oxidoreductase